MTTITVVTPWHNAHELADGYWTALVSSGAEAIYVIDNGSGPPVDAEFRSETNLGFSRASNIGLHKADTDAVLFLNNDIVHTAPGWLDPIRSALRPGVLVGAQLRVDEHTKVDGRAIPYLDGWCLAGMRDDLLALGGWDEEYEEPSYYGDNDLCLRAKAAGMKLVQVPVALRHLGNYTSRQFDVSGVTQRNYRRYAG